MKQLLGIFLLIFLCNAVAAQSEAEVMPFSADAKRMLTRVVDSLNSAEPAHPATLHAFPQARAYFVGVYGESAPAAADLLAQQPTWEAFLAAFPQDPNPHQTLVAKFSRFEGTPKEESFVESIVSPGNFPHDLTITQALEQQMPHIAGKWLVTMKPHKDPKQQYTQAFYFLSDMESPILPPQYAALLQWVQRLVDPQVSVYLPEAKKGHPEYDLDGLSKWSMARKQKMLQQLRTLKVVTDCMDGSPRSHYEDIALMAAETGNWPVFIHAYLDLMNGSSDDPDIGFLLERPSMPGALNALGDLHVSTGDFAIATLLQSQDLPKGSYNGSTRALANEMRMIDNRKQLEKRIEAMICDPTLDLLNRLWAYRFYHWYLANGSVMTPENAKRLEDLRKNLPDGLGDAQE